MSILVAQDIRKEYGMRLVLSGASLRISRGQRVALVGPNGSGKTTLLRIIAGIDDADSGVVQRGKTRIGYLTQELTEIASDAWEETSRAIAAVLELEKRIHGIEAEMALPETANNRGDLALLMRDYERLTHEFESQDGYNIETRVRSILLGIGLREESLTLPAECLSGGERMRVALARILLSEPDLLILDEPTNHLDMAGIEWLEQFLTRFSGGVLVVAHDRYFLDEVATHVAELSKGQIHQYPGNYSAFLTQKEHRQRREEVERSRLEKEVARIDGIAHNLRSMARVSQAQSKEKRLALLQAELAQVGKSEQERGPGFSLADATHLSAEIAVAKGLGKRFDSTTLFSNIDFLIRGGERIGIIGPNGGGKTTLLRILLGEDSDYQGYARLGPWVRYAYLGQQATFIDEDRTVLQEVCSIKDDQDAAGRHYLARYLFRGDDVNKPISVLSGGERTRLRLACLVLEQPHCLILDEPTNHLDMEARECLEDTLSGFHGTVIAVSHDRYFLNRVVTRILELRNNTMLSYVGNYSAYRRARLMSRGEGQGDSSAGRAIRGSLVSQAGSKKPSLQSRVRAAKQENALDLEKQIRHAEERLRELELVFQEGHGRGRDGQKAYKEYEDLLVEVNVLYEAWMGMQQS